MQPASLVIPFWKASLCYVVLVTAIVAGFFTLYFVDTHFRIKEITLYQSSKSPQPRGIEAFYGDFSLGIDTEIVSRELKRQNPYIKDVRVTLTLPDRLNIHLAVYTPVAALRGAQGDFILASDGTILEKKRGEEKTLPRIVYYQTPNFFRYQAGQKYDYRDIIATIAYIKKLRALAIPVTVAEVTDSTQIRLIAGEQSYLFTMEKDHSIQWYQMERLMKELAISGQKYTSIDVRFEKPVYEPFP